jgi:tetratricopeptide (TPR) repeat protein
MKKFKSSAVLATLTVLSMLALSASVLHSKSAQDLYLKAMSQEKTQGNLEQAIAIYTKVIAGAGADRALAARAQYHIGLCYEKLGTAEAEKAFRKVIDRCPEQKESVSAANERLALLAKVSGAGQGTRGGIVLRQVSIPVEGQPSPEEKFLPSHSATRITMI